jgi:Leucine-rich repeat (LRR) protein
MGWEGSDVSFLAELPELKSVEIYSWSLRDASVIGSLRELRAVGLECDLRVSIALASLPKLEVFKGRWKAALASLFQCHGLKRLNVVNWPNSDLTVLADMTGLTELLLSSRKLSSLEGVAKLGALEWLDVDRCPSLSSLEPIRACRMLRHLEVTSCKGFRDIEPVGALKHLQVIHLDDDGEIETLAPLQTCLELEHVSFFGTTQIKDGAISVLERLPKLRTLVFAPRRAYDRTRVEILSRARA